MAVTQNEVALGKLHLAALGQQALLCLVGVKARRLEPALRSTGDGRRLDVILVREDGQRRCRVIARDLGSPLLLGKALRRGSHAVSL